MPAAGRRLCRLPAGRSSRCCRLPTRRWTSTSRALAMRSEPVTNARVPRFRAARIRSGGATASPAVFAESRYLEHWPASRCDWRRRRRAQPVVKVSWFAAEAYCEAERRVCRPGTNGSTSRPPTRRVAMRARIRPGATAFSAGTRAPPAARWQRSAATANAYGVRDLHGLVWEWVDDFNALLVSADNREQGDPDLLKFCGAGALVDAGSRQLRRADAHRHAVLAARPPT